MRPQEPGGRGSEGTYHAGSEQASRFRGKALDARASALQPTRTFDDERPGRPGPCSRTAKVGDEGFG